MKNWRYLECRILNLCTELTTFIVNWNNKKQEIRYESFNGTDADESVKNKWKPGKTHIANALEQQNRQRPLDSGQPAIVDWWESVGVAWWFWHLWRLSLRDPRSFGRVTWSTTNHLSLIKIQMFLLVVRCQNRAHVTPVLTSEDHRCHFADFSIQGSQENYASDGRKGSYRTIHQCMSFISYTCEEWRKHQNLELAVGHTHHKKWQPPIAWHRQYDGYFSWTNAFID